MNRSLFSISDHAQWWCMRYKHGIHYWNTKYFTVLIILGTLPVLAVFVQAASCLSRCENKSHWFPLLTGCPFTGKGDIGWTNGWVPVFTVVGPFTCSGVTCLTSGWPIWPMFGLSGPFTRTEVLCCTSGGLCKRNSIIKTRPFKIIPQN